MNSKVYNVYETIGVVFYENRESHKDKIKDSTLPAFFSAYKIWGTLHRFIKCFSDLEKPPHSHYRKWKKESDFWNKSGKLFPSKRGGANSHVSLVLDHDKALLEFHSSNNVKE